MPSGYTADLYEGKNVSFTEFALQCARAFGAAIDQRDDSTEAPLRLPIPRLDYHENGLSDARSEVERLKRLTAEELEAAAEEDFQKALAHWKETEALSITREKAYRHMLAEAQSWRPPTANHEGMKKFMVEQLEGSIKHDCDTSFWSRPERKTAAEWLELKQVTALSNIDYHTKHMAEEIERVEGRRKWITDLAHSLGLEVDDDKVVADAP